MKTSRKVLLVIACVILIPLLVVFAIRGINALRYPTPDITSSNQQALENYPLSDSHGQINSIDHGRVQGFHMIPAASTTQRQGLLVVFGGSEGSSNYDTAYSLYEQGYEVLSLYFFGQKGLSPTLNRVDLGFFEEIEDYISQKAIQSKPLTVVGVSKGAELSLLLTQYYDSIDNVVLYAPSTCVFQGLDTQNQASSWTYQGEELPYCSFRNSSPKALMDMLSAMLLNYPISFRENYLSLSQNISPESPEWIYKKPIKGHILVFAGSDDQMWPSDQMGEKLYEAFPSQVEFHLYKNAGHIFGAFTYGNGYAFGGTIEANIQAEEESHAILLHALEEWHSQT